MKTRIFAALFSVLFAHSVYSQIPNSGFENWTSMGNYSTPDGWGNLNAMTAAAGVFTCMKATPGNPGSSFLRLVSQSVPGMGMQPGIAVSGILNTTTYKAVSGFAYTSRPANLKGNWQYMAYGADRGYIAVYLTRWNMSMNKRDTIGQLVYLLPGMVMSWQVFTLPITYFSADSPDSAMIVLSSSGANPVSPSYLFIDNLTFEGGTAGLGREHDQHGLKIFPNPVSNKRLNLELGNVSITATQIDILDMRGILISRKSPGQLHFPVSFDVSELRSGEYLVRIASSAGVLNGRFIIQ